MADVDTTAPEVAVADTGPQNWPPPGSSNVPEIQGSYEAAPEEPGPEAQPSPEPVPAGPTNSFQVTDIPRLVKEPDFQSAAPEQQEQWFDHLVGNVTAQLQQHPEITSDDWQTYGQMVDANRNKFAPGTLSNLGHGTVDTVKSLGKTIAAVPGAIPPAAQHPVEMSRTVGNAAVYNVGSMVSGVSHYIQRHTPGTTAHELDRRVDDIKQKIDEGKEFPVGDPEKQAKWVKERSHELLPLQQKMDSLGSTAGTSRLDGAKNAMLLSTYIHTRNPKAWAELRQRLTRSQLERYQQEAKEGIDASEGAKAFDHWWGKGAHEHLIGASDPSNLLFFLRAAKAASAGSKLLKAGKFTGEMAAYGALNAIRNDSGASLSDLGIEALKSILAGSVLHASGAVVRRAFGKKPVNEPTSSASASASRSPDPVITPQGGEGSIPSAGTSSTSASANVEPVETGSAHNATPAVGEGSTPSTGASPPSGGPGAAGASEFGTRQFSMRTAASPELRASWRAGITPQSAQYFKFHVAALQDWVKAKVQELGLENAYALFHDPEAGLQSYEKIALGGELMRQLDARAAQSEKAGNAADEKECTIALDNVFSTVESLSTNHAQGLRAFGEILKGDPATLQRKAERDMRNKPAEGAAQDFAPGTGEGAASIANTELQKARGEAVQGVENSRWDALITAMADMAQEAKRRGKEFVFKLTGKGIGENRLAAIQRAEWNQARFRSTLEQDGASKIAAAFFRGESPNPRSGPGPLVQASDAIKNSLAEVLNEALDKLGIKKADSSKPKVDEVQRLVSQLGLDDLRQGKIAAVDKIIRERIASVVSDEGGSGGFTEDELAARQSWADDMIEQWEKVSSAMRSTTVSGATMRRVIHGVLEKQKLDLNDLAKDNDVQRKISVAKIAKAVREEANASAGGNLDATHTANVEKMAGDTFRKMLEQKRAAQARAAAKRASAPPDYQKTAAWMNNQYATAFSDTPSLSSKPNLLRTLVNQHLKTPLPDFADRAQALGVLPDTAAMLDRMLTEQRRRADEVARVRAGSALVKKLQDSAKTKAARDRVPGMVQDLLKAYETGVVHDSDFLDAYARAHHMPVLDAATRKTLSELKEQIRNAPQNSFVRDDLMRQFVHTLGKAEGVKIFDLATSVWFANTLSGVRTQGNVAIANSVNHLLRGMTASLSHPQSFLYYVKGVFEGMKQGIPEFVAAMQGKALRSDLERGLFDKPHALEMLYNPDAWNSFAGAAKNALSIGRFVGRTIKAVHFEVFYRGAREGRAWQAASEWARGESKRTGGNFTAYVADALHNTTADMDKALKQATAESSAMSKPMDSQQIQRRAWEIVDQSRRAEVRAESTHYGERMSQQQELGGTVGAITDAMAGFFDKIGIHSKQHGTLSIGKLIFNPFVHFIARSTSNYLDFTPVGVVRGITGKYTSRAVMDWGRTGWDMAFGHRIEQYGRQFTDMEARERLTAGVLGTSLGAVLMAMAWKNKDQNDVDVPFMLYGDGPISKTHRDQMPPKWKPYSIKIGDRYISMNETALGPMLGTMGNIMDAARYKKDWKKEEWDAKAAYVGVSMAHMFTSHTAAQGLRDLVDLFNGEKSPGPIVGRTAAGFVMPTGLLGDIKRLMGEPNVKPSTLWGAMMRDVPFIRVSANKPARNVFGEAISPQEIERLPITRMVSDPSFLDDDFRFLGEHRLQVPELKPDLVVVPDYLRGHPEAKQGFYDARAGRLGAAYEKVWTESEADKFVKISGEGSRNAVQLLRRQYENAPQKPTDEQLQKILNAQIRAARKIAALKMAGL